MFRKLSGAERKAMERLRMGYRISHSQNGYTQCGRQLNGRTVDNLCRDGFIREDATFGFDLTPEGDEALAEAEEMESTEDVRRVGRSEQV